MAQARIGRVRLKSGGAEVRLVHQQTSQERDANWAGELAGFAKRVVEHADTNGAVTGFIAVAFYEDGSTWSRFRWGDKAPCNRAMLPAYVAEVVRRDAITEAEAAAIFDEMFERT